MIIIRNSITTLASEGRMTLQVPCIALTTTSDDPTVEYEDLPDEWFCQLKHEGRDQRPTIGKESGFLYLSRSGLNANRDNIRQVFESAENPRGTWEEFEAAAESHFASVERGRNRKLARLTIQLDQLRCAQI